MTVDDLEESPDAAPVEEMPARIVVRSGPPRGRRPKKRLYVAGAIVLIAIGALIYKGVTSAFVYFKTAAQALEDRAALGTTTFQIEGTVVTGSIHRLSDSSSTFKISSGKSLVTVDNSAVPPSLFAAGVPVVLVGHFVRDTNTFASDQILVKHSNQYKAQYPSRVRSNSGVIH